MNIIDIHQWFKKKDIQNLRVGKPNPLLRTIKLIDITDKDIITISIIELKRDNKLYKLYQQIIDNAKSDGAMFSYWVNNLS